MSKLKIYSVDKFNEIYPRFPEVRTEMLNNTCKVDCYGKRIYNYRFTTRKGEMPIRYEAERSHDEIKQCCDFFRHVLCDDSRRNIKPIK